MHLLSFIYFFLFKIILFAWNKNNIKNIYEYLFINYSNYFLFSPRTENKKLSFIKEGIKKKETEEKGKRR